VRVTIQAMKTEAALRDTLSRDDIRPSKTSSFDALSDDSKRALLRAARGRIVVHLTRKQASEIDIDDSHIMVPTKHGLTQIAIKNAKAYAI